MDRDYQVTQGLNTCGASDPSDHLPDASPTQPTHPVQQAQPALAQARPSLDSLRSTAAPAANGPSRDAARLQRILDAIWGFQSWDMAYDQTIPQYGPRNVAG